VRPAQCPARAAAEFVAAEVVGRPLATWRRQVVPRCAVKAVLDHVLGRPVVARYASLRRLARASIMPPPISQQPEQSQPRAAVSAQLCQGIRACHVLPSHEFMHLVGSSYLM